MPEEYKIADSSEEKGLVQEIEVLKQIAALLTKEGLISLDEKQRFLTIVKGNLERHESL